MVEDVTLRSSLSGLRSILLPEPDKPCQHLMIGKRFVSNTAFVARREYHC